MHEELASKILCAFISSGDYKEMTKNEMIEKSVSIAVEFKKYWREKKIRDYETFKTNSET